MGVGRVFFELKGPSENSEWLNLPKQNVPPYEPGSPETLRIKRELPPEIPPGPCEANPVLKWLDVIDGTGERPEWLKVSSDEWKLKIWKTIELNNASIAENNIKITTLASASFWEHGVTTDDRNKAITSKDEEINMTRMGSFAILNTPENKKEFLADTSRLEILRPMMQDPDAIEKLQNGVISADKFLEDPVVRVAFVNRFSTEEDREALEVTENEKHTLENAHEAIEKIKEENRVIITANQELQQYDNSNVPNLWEQHQAGHDIDAPWMHEFTSGISQSSGGGNGAIDEFPKDSNWDYFVTKSGEYIFYDQDEKKTIPLKNKEEFQEFINIYTAFDKPLDALQKLNKEEIFQMYQHCQLMWQQNPGGEASPTQIRRMIILAMCKQWDFSQESDASRCTLRDIKNGGQEYVSQIKNPIMTTSDWISGFNRYMKQHNFQTPEWVANIPTIMSAIQKL